MQRELIRVGKSIERLLTAYQEELLSLEQLRERLPSLRQREQTLRAELQAIADQANDRATFLRLAEPSRRSSAVCAAPLTLLR